MRGACPARRRLTSGYHPELGPDSLPCPTSLIPPRPGGAYTALAERLEGTTRLDGPFGRTGPGMRGAIGPIQASVSGFAWCDPERVVGCVI